MTHLVIVIDEFRVLVDQFPDAMNELMRIAAVGRSLGIHLVMATQRPQGALSADIRANVTSSICLRVQSSLDSVDVIGTAQAAAIDVGAPGRAYLSRAGRAPLEFQSATLRLPTNAGQGLPRVERVADLLAADAQDPVCESAPGPEESDVPALAELMDRAWQQSLAAGEGLQQATAVVAEDLPSVLTNADLDSRRLPASGSAPGAAPGQALTLGLVDVPQGQCLAALRWHPGSQSHLACFGTVGETSRAVGLAVGQSQLANSGTAGHPPTLLYLLDGDGSLGPCAPSPWTGACLSPSNLRAVARLVQRLESTLRTDPRMHLLAITDWSRWVSALRSSPWHGVEEELGELIRFSPPNLAVAMGGGRELLSASFLAAIPNRMFFSHGSNTESTMLWPRLPRFQPQPGRAVVSGPINNVSAFLHGPDDAGAGETLHIAQLAQPPVCPTTGNTGIHGGAPASANPPADLLKVRELPSRLGMAEFRALLRADSHAGARAGGQRGELLLGVGGDGLDPVSIVLTPGGVLPVLGGPGTGKSSFIRALRQLQGRTWTPASAGILVIAGAPAGTGSVGGDGSVGILLLDDAHAMTAEALLTATQGLAAGGSIVAVIPYPGSALSRIPLEWGVRTAQQAVVLMPQRPADGDLLGVRLETSGAEPPGRAVLLDRGRSTWFQFPRAEDAP